jgi:hypothetical protein
MSERIYLPVRCARCAKMSIVSFASKDATLALKSGNSFSFTCAFDGANWVASPAERWKVQRLLNESERTRDRPYLRLRGDHRGAYGLDSRKFTVT